MEVLSCLYWRFYQADHSTLWWMVVGVNWLTLCHEYRRAVFWASYCSSCTPQNFFSTMQNTLLGYADDSTLMVFVPTPCVRVTVAKSLIRDLGRIGDGCDLWGMKLYASKTMIVTRSSTMHPQSLPLTIGGTVLKESDDLGILGVTFDSKMTVKKHLRSVSKAASQRLCILQKSWRVFHDRSLHGRCFWGYVLPGSEYCSAVWCPASDTHIKLLDRVVTSQWCSFSH